MELLAILISSMLINNIVLMQFLGLCSFFGVSTKMKSVVGMGLAVIVVIFLAALITYPIYKYVLVELNITYIDTIAFILVIASLVQLTELVIKRVSKSLYKALGVYLPLIATNCAVLGVALNNVSDIQNTTYPEALMYALGSGLGFAFIIITFTAIRLRLDSANVPKALKGMPIALVTAGLMALAFMGLSGII
ncbi:electron transport complex subunit RsxA [Tenericutes bacterium MZ-XQ]|jgi:electron transport complex protein RnfA|nr:electron transport complex subunit RsxA [Tenericutes bacterium MZ-XQ]